MIINKIEIVNAYSPEALQLKLEVLFINLLRKKIISVSQSESNIHLSKDDDLFTATPWHGMVIIVYQEKV